MTTKIQLDSISTADQVLAEAARLQPECIAIQSGQTSITYAQLERTANHLSASISAAVTTKQERIGFLGHNSVEFVALMFGSLRANCVWTPLNWRLPMETLARLVKEAGIRHLFHDQAMNGLAQELAESCDIKLHDCSSVLTDAPLKDLAARPQASLTHENGEHTALQIYTSGTSGLPKGVMLSHHALLASRVAERAIQQAWSQWDVGEVNLVCMPNFHISGVLSIFGGICNLGRTILLPQFEVKSVLAVLRDTPPARLLLVPSAIKLLLDDPESQSIDFSNIKYVFYGGSPMPEPLMRDILSRMNCEFVQFYGMTETAGRATFLAPSRHHEGPGQKLNAAGQAFPGVEIQIRSADGNKLDAGDSGEICLRSPSLMQAYWQRPEDTTAALAGGWYHTGDVGFLDRDGELHVVDRLNDKIVTGGENVYPSEVEAVLREHPAVEDAAVFGMPDPKWIEAIHAAVVTSPGQTIDTAELRLWSRERLGAYKTPKQIVILDSLPRSATGKVLRKDIAHSLLSQPPTQATNDTIQ